LYERGDLMGIAVGSRFLQSRARLYINGSTPFESDFTGTRRALAAKAFLLAAQGRATEAREIISQFDSIAAPHDESGAHVIHCLLEAAIQSRDEAACTLLLPRLEVLADHISEHLVSTGRLCGEAAALLGRPADAHRLFGIALNVCQRVRFRPEIALIRLDLAE